MYDVGKIITGLVIFLVILSFPLWYNAGHAAYKVPELQLPKDKKECIESKQWMRANHMELLNEWRDEVVRNNMAMYVNAAGKEIPISLQNTCMKCHSSKEKFCDKCHQTAAVDPYCWDCHVAPEEVGHGQE